MESIVFRVFGTLFRIVGILIFTGTIATVLIDLQKRAGNANRIGLVSLLSVNSQLVGRAK
jgi:hypothetical protein